ncbi:42135_t:CDS:2, partial [Gigaspora margarita]
AKEDILYPQERQKRDPQIEPSKAKDTKVYEKKKTPERGNDRTATPIVFRKIVEECTLVAQSQYMRRLVVLYLEKFYRDWTILREDI